MNIERIPLDKLNAAKYNPRKDLKPGDVEFEKLRRSIEEFGYVEPIIWNKRTGNIVGGHQRAKVLKHLGRSEADCVVLDIDDTKEKALNIALNKISGSWDDALLSSLMQDLELSEFDVSLTGFDELDIKEMLSDKKELQDEFDADKKRNNNEVR